MSISSKVRRKHRMYVKRRRLGPEALLLGFDRDVYCRKCGQIDKVKTREEVMASAKAHLCTMDAIRKAKKRIKKLHKLKVAA